MANPFENLTHALSRLPGIGRRSAERIALALVRKGDEVMLPLLEALADVRENVCACRLCGSITTRQDNPCRLCSDTRRDHALLCVVEDPGDIMAIERSGAFTGVYHALHGRISPMAASGPEDIRLAELRRRLEGGAFREVVLALATDVEGDATAAYIAETLSACHVTVTRLAFGLPADSGIGYSDPVTLKRAISGRQSL
ncbi:MAG: recombination mediator RecR [Kiritimatiellae bacterium]|nr:recombination mediator RecR [Kiritimatiellia bacterium]